MYLKLDCKSIRIETSRLFLRGFKEGNLNDFYDYAKVPDVGEWAGWSHHKDINESKKILGYFISDSNVLALADKKSSKVIGSLGLDKSSWSLERPELINLKTVELGYVLSKDYWGKGLMTEVVKAVIDYLFKNTAIDFITICHWDKNVRSEKVIRNCGFTYLEEGPSKTLFDDSIRNDKRYILYRKDYLKNETNSVQIVC